jgi:tetratricopeptide (TPR) repeat protein
VLGLVYADVGEYSRARDHLEEALRVFRAIGDPYGEWNALFRLGCTAAAMGDYVAARTCLEQAPGIVRDVEPTWETSVLTWLALIFHHLGDDEAAREYANRAPQADRIASPSGQLTLASSIVQGHALAGLGQLDEAADAYRQALGLWQETGRRHLVPEPLAGLARVALAHGDHTQALAHVGEILDVLETRPGLEGTIEPLRIYLTCYQVLRAHDDPRAEEILDAGYQLLQERAETIDDEALRRSYLENVPYHRQIVEAWEARNH